MKTLITNVYTALLALTVTGQRLDYIKKIYRADPGASVILEYPSICIGAVSLDTKAQTLGRGGIGSANNGQDETTFRMNIFAATRNHDGQTAFFGDSTTGEKGILDVCDDLRNIIRGEYFSGTLSMPANITNIQTNYIVETAGHIWVAQLSVEGRRQEKRPR
jgi:hypothetical protein